MKFKTALMTLLLATILNSVFAMSKRYAAGYTPFVVKMLKGEIPEANIGDRIEQENRKRYGSYALDANGTMIPLADATPGSIAVIRNKGVMMKETICGIPGTQEMAANFLEVEKNPNFLGSVFHSSSPGGMVDGMETLGSTIKGL